MEREAEKKNTFKDVKKQQQQIFFLLKYPSLCTPLMFLSTLMRFCGVKLGLEIISHYNDPLRLSQVERN